MDFAPNKPWRGGVLLADGTRPCCARLRGLVPDGEAIVTFPCPVCGKMWAKRFDGTAASAQRLVEGLTRLALESGNVCLHEVGETVNGETVTAEDACPCGKNRLVLEARPGLEVKSEG